jgi:hypothetical protein
MHNPVHKLKPGSRQALKEELLTWRNLHQEFGTYLEHAIIEGLGQGGVLLQAVDQRARPKVVSNNIQVAGDAVGVVEQRRQVCDVCIR